MTQRDFLDRLSAADRAALEQLLVIRDYAEGEVVISHLDDSRDVFFVLQGRVRATLYSQHGSEVGYREIGPGDVVGELAAIDGAPRSATVEALEPTQLGHMSAEAFLELIEVSTGLNTILLEHLTAQIRRLTERVFEFSTLRVRDRLIRELLRQAGGGGARKGRAEIRPAPTQADLAARISSHREVVSREMSVLAKAGLVEKRGGALIISSLDELNAIQEKQ